LNAVTTSASVHDNQVAIPMARMTAERVTALYELMDSAYVAKEIEDVCKELGHVPIIDLHWSKTKKGITLEPARERRYDERTVVERANGRLWGAEMVANSFAGPPLGSLLIGLLFALPFFFDAGTFAVAAGLVFLVTGDFRSHKDGTQGSVQWRKEIGEGFGWLWRHPLLRPMAIILGLLNGLGMVTFATFVLFAQEVLGVDAFIFAIIGTGGAIGGIIGSLAAPKISAKLGSGTSLYITLVASAVTSLIIGVSSFWVVAWVMFTLSTFAAVLWNVITVSLRQTIIPDRLLGRVNSVYRFFGWGMIPIGLGIGGVVLSVAETVTTRTMALRMPWLIAAIAYTILFFYAAPRLTTDKIETARVEGVAAKHATSDEAASSAEPADG
jgi:hypothetical protein